MYLFFLELFIWGFFLSTGSKRDRFSDVDSSLIKLTIHFKKKKELHFVIKVALSVGQ